MNYNCLIVDDETELAQMTCEYLNMFDIKSAYVDNVQDFYQFMNENNVDLLLIDINLGDESGFQICKKIRKSSDIPILFISARQSDDDVLTALNIGGDDYIKKPYTLSILLAKVRVILKRMSDQKKLDTISNEAESEKIQNEKIYLNKDNMKVYINGKEVSLKAKEYKLLDYLIQHKNTIVSKEQLFNEVWGDSFYSDGTLNVHIRRLREKIEEDPGKPQIIKTIWGTGYILEL